MKAWQHLLAQPMIHQQEMYSGIGNYSMNGPQTYNVDQYQEQTSKFIPSLEILKDRVVNPTTFLRL
jgi:hypothetical protein